MACRLTGLPQYVVFGFGMGFLWSSGTFESLSVFCPMAADHTTMWSFPFSYYAQLWKFRTGCTGNVHVTG